MNSNNQTIGSDDRVYEKIKTTHLIYPSTLLSIFIFVVTFYFYYNSGLVLISFLPFYSSYVFSYLFLVVIIYVITVIIFRKKAIQMKIFAPHIMVYGYHPLEFSSRLGVKLVDIIGAVISFVFCIISQLISPLKLLFPGFMLFFLSFLSSIIWSNQRKWEFKRRN